MFRDWLASRAASIPDHVALAVGSRFLTYRDLDREATTLARKLVTLGVQSGDRVCTRLPNGFLAAVLPHAVLRLGATVVPLNTRLTDAEIEWQVRDVEPRIVIDDAIDFDEVEEGDASIALEHDPEHVLAIIYTSGTTGQPKGAMLTVGNFWWSAVGSALNLGTHNDDNWLLCMPMFHVGGLSIILRAVIYGITTTVHESFDTARVNSAIDTDRVTIVSAVSVMLERVLEDRQDKPFPSTLRCILLGGGPASQSLLDRCARINAPIVQTYGLTESCSQVATMRIDEAGTRVGSSGKALYPNEITISHVDEILVRGPVVMKGYYNNKSDTLNDGWLHTGDAGRLDNDGYLYVLDRRDDLIITGGENVYPAEVEAVLSAHPSVDEACVIGVSDGKWGQRVVAIVKAKAGPDENALREHCATRLARFKHPAEFRFVDSPLPRTASGKLKRAEVRATATSQ